MVVEYLSKISICQILIEVHGWIDKEENGRKKLVARFNATQSLNILRKISEQGFYLFSHELNIWISEVAEYSFIHESCFQKYGVNTLIGKFLT